VLLGEPPAGAAALRAPALRAAMAGLSLGGGDGESGGGRDSGSGALLGLSLQSKPKRCIGLDPGSG